RVSAVLAKDLEPVLAPVADIDEAVAIDSEAMDGIAELSRRGTDWIGAHRRGAVVRFLAVCAPVPFVRAGPGVEHNHAMVLIHFAVRDVDLVRARVHAHLRR